MRKNIFILGLLVAIMSLSFATLGVTVFTADRTATIGVANDANGVLTIQANTDTSFVENTNGTFALDTSVAGTDGLNKNSTLELGSISGGDVVQNEEAFEVTNDLGDPVTVNLDYVVDNPGAFNTNTKIEVVLTEYDSTGAVVQTDTMVVDSTGVTKAQLPSVAVDSTVEGAVVINTQDGVSGESLGGTLEFSAQK